jgi:hypothetical protein
MEVEIDFFRAVANSPAKIATRRGMDMNHAEPRRAVT